MMSKGMSGQERVMKALNFEEPDRVPRLDEFWPEFTDVWRKQKGLGPDANPKDYYGTDMMVVAAEEAPWPSKAKVIKRDGKECLARSGWGSLQRSVEGAHFSEDIEPALSERSDPDKLKFDDPLLDSRYEEAGKQADEYRGRCAVFCKTGGPYLRPVLIRGMTNLLIDIVEDPDWVKAFVERVTDHMIQVGVEQIRRYKLESTGIGIFDDIADNRGLIMGLPSYEKLFYPSLQKMVKAYKDAGAAKVFHHCDGNVEGVLDLWVEAGIDAVNPLEARAGMDPLKVREEYDGKLAIIGGLDNCDVLVRGSREEIKQHVLHVLQAGHGGGLVVAAHSIGPDISANTYDYVTALCREHGSYPLAIS